MGGAEVAWFGNLSMRTRGHAVIDGVYADQLIGSVRRDAARRLHLPAALLGTARSWPSFDRRQPQAGKISCKGGRRPSRVTRSALVGDLARLHNGAPGGWTAFTARAPGADR